MIFDIKKYSSYSELGKAVVEYSKKLKKELAEELYFDLVAADVSARAETKIRLELAEPEFEEAIAELFGKVPVTAEQLAAIESKYKRMVFGTKSLMGVEDSLQFAVLEKAQNLIGDAIKGNLTYGEFLEKMGEDGIIPERRLELIFHQNITQAYNSGAWQQLYEQFEEDVELVFTTGQDERVDEDCSQWDGYVALKSDPIWETLWPPLHFGCRCGTRMALDNDIKNAKPGGDPEEIDEDFRTWPGDGFTISVPSNADLEQMLEILKNITKFKMISVPEQLPLTVKNIPE